MIDLDELERLHKASAERFPVPWIAEELPYGTEGKTYWEVTYGPADDASERYAVFDCDADEATCKLAVRMRNALPEMIAEIRRLRLAMPYCTCGKRAYCHDCMEARKAEAKE